MDLPVENFAHAKLDGIISWEKDTQDKIVTDVTQKENTGGNTFARIFFSFFLQVKFNCKRLIVCETLCSSIIHLIRVRLKVYF